MAIFGAVVHKLCNIVFAVLRDENPFEFVSSQNLCQKHPESAVKTA